MTEEVLKKSNTLITRIHKMSTHISDLKSKHFDTIEFSYQMGRDGFIASNDEDVIKKAKALILEESEIKLAKLKTEFENL